MKIIKYEKKKNEKVKIYLEDNNVINTYEDVILKNNVLYKKELDSNTYDKIINDNQYEDAYLKCVNYIKVRLRSKNEIKRYLTNKGFEEDVINEVIIRLENQNLLNEQNFAIAFTHDKFRFTNNGPYRIYQELKSHNIDTEIINIAINEITIEEQNEKIEKLIEKQLKNKKMDSILKTKIYNKLVNAGHSKELVINILNKFV